MKYLMFIQRCLATMIDLIIIFVPSLLLVHVLFTSKDMASFANLLAGVLFVLYNMIAESSFSGRTIGKYFAKLKVNSVSSDLMEIGQREFAKLLYFIPIAGWLFLGLSVVLYFVKGWFLHDKIGRSEVVTHV